MSWLQKYGMLLIAIAIAAYAIHGLMGADLAMPYSNIGGFVRGTRFFHLRGMWAIGGSICLLLSAAGFALVSYGKLIAKPGTTNAGMIEGETPRQFLDSHRPK